MPLGGVRPIALLPVPGQPTVRPMFRSLAIAASGLSAQRQRMETIAQNIANVGVATAPDGTGYKRRTVVMATANQATAAFGSPIPMGIAGTIANPQQPFGSAPFDVPAMADERKMVQVPVLPVMGDGQPYGVAVTGVAEDQSEGHLNYEPGHPYADANGYVRYPDIDTTQETVNQLDAKRLYEANASVFQAVKAMLRAALDI